MYYHITPSDESLISSRLYFFYYYPAMSLCNCLIRECLLCIDLDMVSLPSGEMSGYGAECARLGEVVKVVVD